MIACLKQGAMMRKHKLVYSQFSKASSKAVMLSALLLLSSAAQAENRLLLGVGSGYGAHSVQLGGQWLQDWRPLLSGQLSYGVAAEVAAWRSAEDDLIQLSLVPLVQYNFLPHAQWQPIIFAGVGLAWISDTQLGNRDLSSEFQFSSRAGVGLMKGRHSVAFAGRHLSNGGIKQPNQGISYWNLSYGYRF